jgi:hypothetical protein
MKRTLLDLTQNILSAMNSDEVNSIGDTTESTQVAEIIRTTYYNILGRAELPEHDKLFNLASSTNSSTPTVMFRPSEGVVKINWMKYFDTNPNDIGGNTQVDQFGSFSHGLNVDLINPVAWLTTSTTTNTIGVGTKSFTVQSSTLPAAINQLVAIQNGLNIMFGTILSYAGTTMVISVTNFSGAGTFSSWQLNNTTTTVGPGYRTVQPVTVHDFVNMVSSFDPLDPTVQTYSFTDFLNTETNSFRTEIPDTVTLFYKNNKQPTYYCVLQNYYFIFDSYDNSQDSALQSTKSLVSGFITPNFYLVDNFIPDLDDWAFPLLLNESKSLAFFELKGESHPQAEREIERQWSALQKTKAIVNKPTYLEQLPNFGRQGGTGGYAIRPTSTIRTW